MRTIEAQLCTAIEEARKAGNNYPKCDLVDIEDDVVIFYSKNHILAKMSLQSYLKLLEIKDKGSD